MFCLMSDQKCLVSEEHILLGERQQGSMNFTRVSNPVIARAGRKAKGNDARNETLKGNQNVTSLMIAVNEEKSPFPVDIKMYESRSFLLLFSYVGIQVKF